MNVASPLIRAGRPRVTTNAHAKSEHLADPVWVIGNGWPRRAIGLMLPEKSNLEPVRDVFDMKNRCRLVGPFPLSC